MEWTDLLAYVLLFVLLFFVVRLTPRKYNCQGGCCVPASCVLKEEHNNEIQHGKNM